MAPTPRGIGLLVAAAALLAAGFGFGYPELAVLGVTAVIAAGTALAHTVWQPRLGVSRAAEPDRVPRGDPSTMTLTVTNTSRLRSATLIAHDRCDTTPASAAPDRRRATTGTGPVGRVGTGGVGRGRQGARTVPVPVLRLRPRRDTGAAESGGQDRSATEVSYPVPTGRRGVVRIGPLRVTRRDPLGLIGLSRDQGGTTQVWVYPRIHPLIAVPAGVARSLDGRIDRVPHGSITFDTLREYVVGDELRHVHWRTTARVGELMVREHLDTSLPRIVVLLDDRAASHPTGAGPGTRRDGGTDGPGARNGQHEQGDNGINGPDGQAEHGAADDVVETFESACEAAASVVAAAIRADLAIALHLVSGRAVGGGRRATTSTRDFLDLLAEATLHGSDDQQLLQTATQRLRQQRLGDTLVYLTGPAGRRDLGLIGALRGAYPSVVVGVFGDDSHTQTAAAGRPVRRDRVGTAAAAAGRAGAGRASGAPAADAGLVVLDAHDGADFAAEWDGVTAW